MRQAIGDVLPLAIAAAISPFPITGVVLMLVTPWQPPRRSLPRTCPRATRWSHFVVYALIATLGVAAPIFVYFTMGDRSERILDTVKTWLAHNNATIVAVIFLIIGAKVLGQGIAG